MVCGKHKIGVTCAKCRRQEKKADFDARKAEYNADVQANAPLRFRGRGLRRARRDD